MRFFSIFSLFILIAPIAEAEQMPWPTKLTVAIKQENANQILAVLSEGKDLNMVLPNGRYPIAVAAVQSSPEVIDILVNGGIDPDVRDEAGYSPVMLALQFGRIDNAKKLHALGASLEGVTNDGYTVRLLAENVGLENFGPAHPLNPTLKISSEEADQILLYAAEAGDIDTVKFALDNGASVHAKANNGWTATMLAGLGGHKTILYTLILNGALEFNGIYHAAKDVDLITAILVGEGGSNQKPSFVVESMLEFILKNNEVTKTSILKDRGTEYRAISEKMGYPLFVLDIFPETYEALPRLSSVIPFGIPATNENWKRVQKILNTKGFYKGGLDGDPGRGTMGALYAYFKPLINVVRQRSIEVAGSAHRNGKVFLKTDAVGAICPMILASSTNRKHKVCGEFKRKRGGSIFTTEFSGYAFSEFKKDLNVYGYFTGGTDFANVDIHIEITENYSPSAGNKFPHTQIYASVLDKTFKINIFDKKTEYFFSSKRKQTLPGNFSRPQRPDVF